MIKRKYLSACALIMAACMAFTGCGDATSSTVKPTEAPKTEATTNAPSTEVKTEAPDTDAPVTEAPKTEEPEIKEDIKDEDIQLEGYNLLWHDEFSGDELDTSIWTKEIRERGWTNNELQAYVSSSDNIFLRNGKLVLKAIKKSDRAYTSGKVNSQNKKDFLYGRVEVRAKTPAGKGLWPAIWMMPKNGTYGDWPRSGEIDIMEILGDNVLKTYSTIHYGNPHAEQQGTYYVQNPLEEGTFASAFHTFVVDWEPGLMKFYTDGHLVLEVNDWFTSYNGLDEEPYPAPFDKPFYVQLNLAVGGNWPGDPDANTDFDKAEFEIDYVRVYQKPEYNTDVKKPEKVYKQPDSEGNFLVNGHFDTELDRDADWTFYQTSGGTGDASVSGNELTINMSNAGTEDYSIQLYQANMPQYRGKKYKLSYDAYADEARTIISCVSAPTAGWTRYLEDTKVELTTEKTHYEFEYTMNNKDDNNGRVEFNLGNQGSTASVHISNVKLEEIQ